MSPVDKIQHVLAESRRQPGGPGDLGRLRIALCAVFAAHGFMFASWAVRIPAIKEQTAASSAALIAWLTRDPPALSDNASHPGT